MVNLQVWKFTQDYFCIFLSSFQKFERYLCEIYVWKNFKPTLRKSLKALKALMNLWATWHRWLAFTHHAYSYLSKTYAQLFNRMLKVNIFVKLIIINRTRLRVILPLKFEHERSLKHLHELIVYTSSTSQIFSINLMKCFMALALSSKLKFFLPLAQF